MDGLNLDNILDSNEIENLFVGNDNTEDTPPTENKEEIKEDNKEDTTEVNPDSLFEDEPESVGSEEKNIEEKEDATSDKDGSSPNTNPYSSIAEAFKEDGIFPDLDDDTISKVKSAEDFRDLVEQQIKNSLDERQKRIDDALNAGIESSEIRRYENTIATLNNITEEAITNEDANGENLRKQLIYQDFINRGYSKERANREVTKSFNAGTDIDDAKEALNSNKEFFQEQYDNLINDAKAEEEKELKARKEQAENLKKSILEDKKVFGDLAIDKSTRQKIYDNIAKPVYKDPNTGDVYTVIQKYEMENRMDFLKNVSIVYTLTDGFKNLDGLVNGKVKKEVKTSLRNLENVINNTARNSNGNIKYASSVSDDPESFLKGWSIDV